MAVTDTEKYIKQHIERVYKHLQAFAAILENRGRVHDASKLQEPELSMWKKMDEEPRYKFGTPEYIDKMKRWKAVFDHHYKCNRHHPEHFEFGIQDMNLVDIVELLADWIGYKDKISYSEASKMIESQCKRFGIENDVLRDVLMNTLNDFFIYFGIEDDRIDFNKIDAYEIKNGIFKHKTFKKDSNNIDIEA